MGDYEQAENEAAPMSPNEPIDTVIVETVDGLGDDGLNEEVLFAVAEDESSRDVVDDPVAESGETLDITGRPALVFPVPAPREHHGPARVLALVNQKGGVGKTTTTINLGASLAGYGRKVLLIDFDPQGALTAGVGINAYELDATVFDLLMEPERVKVRDIIAPTGVAGLDVVPASIDLSAAEMALVNEVAREQILARALDPVLAEYDYILIDCQPSLGLLTVNALAAASGVIIPLECEFFALRGMKILVDTIHKVQARINPRLTIDGILATMYDARTVHRREVLQRVIEAFGDTVFRTVISQTIKFPETTVAGTPITDYAPASSGAEAYRSLARELVFREEPSVAPASPAL